MRKFVAILSLLGLLFQPSFAQQINDSNKNLSYNNSTDNFLLARRGGGSFRGGGARGGASRGTPRTAPRPGFSTGGAGKIQPNRQYTRPTSPQTRQETRQGRQQTRQQGAQTRQQNRQNFLNNYTPYYNQGNYDYYWGGFATGIATGSLSSLLFSAPAYLGQNYSSLSEYQAAYPPTTGNTYNILSDQPLPAAAQSHLVTLPCEAGQKLGIQDCNKARVGLIGRDAVIFNPTDKTVYVYVPNAIQ